MDVIVTLLTSANCAASVKNGCGGKVDRAGEGRWLGEGLSRTSTGTSTLSTTKRERNKKKKHARAQT